MKKCLFHLLCLSALVYLVPKVEGFTPGWRFALASGVVIYSCIASCHLRGFLQRSPTISVRRENDGAALVSEVQRVPVGDGARSEVQNVQEADAEPEMVTGGLGRDQSRDAVTEACEAVVAGAGGVK